MQLNLDVSPVIVLCLIYYIISAQEDVPEEPKFSAFTGTGRRLNGRPAKQEDSVPVAVPSTVNHQAKSTTGNKPGAGSSAEASTSTSKTGRPSGKLVFGANSSRPSKETQKVCKLLHY